MAVSGQTKSNVILKIPHESSSISWDLGKCVIVENLGVDILIGEPAKIDNNIITKSHLRILETKDINGKAIEIPYFNRKDLILPLEGLTLNFLVQVQTQISHQYRC